MPTEQLKAIAKEASKSLSEAEKVWDHQKTVADKIYDKKDKDPSYWGFVVNATKRALGIKK